MGTEPKGCPFCLTTAVRLVANFDDTLTAYECPQCRGVFYTITPQYDAAPSSDSDSDLTSPNDPRNLQ